MEKEIDKKTVVLQDDSNKGQVQIADDVVAMIASLAAAEVDGVVSMAGNLMNKVGVKKMTKGVKVDVSNNEVKILLAVTVQYGHNIPAICAKLQAKVKAAVEYMTGLVCSDVSIRIVGVKKTKEQL